MAVSSVGMFGEGMTQGSPVASHQAPRLQSTQDAQHGDLVEAQGTRQLGLAQARVGLQHGQDAELGRGQGEAAAFVLEHGG